MLKKIRQFLTSALEYLGWGLIGPAVICGVFFISSILFSREVAFGITLSVLGIVLFVTVVVTNDSNHISNEDLSFSAGLVIWIIVSIFLAPETPISISKTTLLVAAIVYGAILVNWLLTPPTPEEYNG